MSDTDLIVDRGRLLTKVQACGYIVASRHLIDKLVKSGKLPVVYLGNRVPRFMLGDLDDFIKSRKRPRIMHETWNIDSDEIPLPVVLRLLGLTRNGYESAQHRKQMPDRRPETIRKYIECQLRVKLVESIRMKYRAKIDNQDAQRKRLEVRLAELQCLSCHKRLYIKRDRVYAKRHR